MKMFSVLAALCCLVIPRLAFAANFSGMWKAREHDGVVANLNDDGSRVTGTLYSTNFDHTLEGTHDNPTRVTMVTTRRNIHSGCVTRMYGYWVLLDTDTARSQIIGTDGRCDLSTNFQETRIYDRR